MSGSGHLVQRRSWFDANLTYRRCAGRTQPLVFDVKVVRRLLAKCTWWGAQMTGFNPSFLCRSETVWLPSRRVGGLESRAVGIAFECGLSAPWDATAINCVWPSPRDLLASSKTQDKLVQSHNPAQPEKSNGHE